MKCKTVSPSGLKKYIQCPKQFDFYYVQRIPATPSTSGLLGSLFHDGMERFTKNHYQKSFTECVRDAVIEDTSKSYTPEMIRGAKEIFTRWIEFADKFLPPPETLFDSEMAFGPPGDRLAEVEVVFDSGLSLHGIIDLIYVHEGNIVVVDYKTSKYTTDNDLPNNVQSMAYALVAHKMCPEASIRVEFWNVSFPENGPEIWYPSDYEEIEEILLSYYQKILFDEEPNANVGESCFFCGYKQACKPWNEWVRNIPIDTYRNDEVEITSRAMFQAMSTEAIVLCLEEIYFKHRNLKTTLDSGKSILKKRMEQDCVKRIGKWEITRRYSTKYDPTITPAVNNLIAHTGKLTKEMKERLKPYERKVYTNPYIWRNWRIKT